VSRSDRGERRWSAGTDEPRFATDTWVGVGEVTQQGRHTRRVGNDAVRFFAVGHVSQSSQSTRGLGSAIGTSSPQSRARMDRGRHAAVELTQRSRRLHEPLTSPILEDSCRGRSGPSMRIDRRWQPYSQSSMNDCSEPSFEDQSGARPSPDERDPATRRMSSGQSHRRQIPAASSRGFRRTGRSSANGSISMATEPDRLRVDR
jgi:hypothetical protein